MAQYLSKPTIDKFHMEAVEQRISAKRPFFALWGRCSPYQKQKLHIERRERPILRQWHKPKRAEALSDPGQDQRMLNSPPENNFL